MAAETEFVLPGCTFTIYNSFLPEGYTAQRTAKRANKMERSTEGSVATKLPTKSLSTS